MSNKSVGEFISKLREEKGLTEKELGEKLGITEKKYFRVGKKCFNA
ncbi:MAG: hypothetical protein IKL70_06870 [Oscillospiraceae bacterium]|nr:hypothetical protein [Oscillospiraceae bacterium]